MEKKKPAKKIEGKKYLLNYTAEIDGLQRSDLWEKINTTKGPCYKNATTLLKRKLHSREETKNFVVVRVNHLYNILV